MVPLPHSVAHVTDSVRFGIRGDGGSRVDRGSLYSYLGYAKVRYSGDGVPEDHGFVLRPLVGNPSQGPDSNALVTVDAGVVKIEKYLVDGFQQGVYLFGGLESPARPEDTVLVEFTCKLLSTDISPDSNDFTGVAFGLFFNNSGFMLRFFDNGSGTRWVELFDADENSIQRPLHPDVRYRADFDWDGKLVTYKIVWDQRTDFVSVLAEHDLVVEEIIVGNTSDFGAIPDDQARDFQPLAWFGHFPKESTSISYWSFAALYNLSSRAIAGGIFQGEHIGFIRPAPLVRYTPETVMTKSEHGWTKTPDMVEELLESELVVSREDPESSHLLVRNETGVSDGAVLEFHMRGHAQNQSGHVTGMEFILDTGDESARVGFLFDLAVHKVGILSKEDPTYFDSYIGSQVDWRVSTSYRLVLSPQYGAILYRLTVGVDNLEYELLGVIPFGDLPDSVLPGPGVGIAHSSDGKSESKIYLRDLWYTMGVVMYHPESLPESPWVQEGGAGTIEATDGELTITTDEGVHFYHPESSVKLNTTNGVYSEFRVRIDSKVDRGNTGVGVTIDNGTNLMILMFADAGPELGKIVYLASKSDMDQSLEDIRSGLYPDNYAQVDWSETHTYRFEFCIGGYLRLFIDGNPVPVIELFYRNVKFAVTQIQVGWSFGSIDPGEWSSSIWEFVYFSASEGFDVGIDSLVVPHEKRFDLAVNVVAYAETL